MKNNNKFTTAKISLITLLLFLIIISYWVIIQWGDKAVIHVVEYQQSRSRIPNKLNCYLIQVQKGDSFILGEDTTNIFTFEKRLNDSLIIISFSNGNFNVRNNDYDWETVHETVVGTDGVLIHNYYRRILTEFTFTLEMSQKYDSIITRNNQKVIDVTEFDNPKSWVFEKEKFNQNSLTHYRWTEKYNDEFRLTKDGMLTGWDMDGKLRIKAFCSYNLLDSVYNEWYDNGNIKVSGYFSDGLKDGAWTYYNIDGSTKYYGEYELGTGTLYYPNRKIRSTEQYKDGKPAGNWNAWYPNGNLQAVINNINSGTNYYKDDGTPFFSPALARSCFNIYNSYDITDSQKWNYKDSLRTFKDWDGNQRRKVFYDDDGFLVKINEWYGDGQMLTELNYKDGFLDGSVSTWSPQGVLIKDFYYSNGKPTGIWKYYSYENIMTEQREYLNDSAYLQNLYYLNPVQIKSTGKIVNEAKDSIWTYWNIDGSIDKYEQWELGELIGTEE